MENRKDAALVAIRTALVAAQQSGDVELSGALASAVYWAAGASNPNLP